MAEDRDALIAEAQNQGVNDLDLDNLVLPPPTIRLNGQQHNVVVVSSMNSAQLAQLRAIQARAEAIPDDDDARDSDREEVVIAQVAVAIPTLSDEEIRLLTMAQLRQLMLFFAERSRALAAQLGIELPEINLNP